jgi:hypothetical protein
MFQEQLPVLVVRSVPGIGIDDQLRSWNLLRHDPGVDRRHHDVVGAVHNEGRLPANPSSSKGSVLSIPCRKFCRRMRGTPDFPPMRRYAWRVAPAWTYCVGAVAYV